MTSRFIDWTAVGAVATWAATFVALFLPKINRWWDRPTLSMHVNSPYGQWLSRRYGTYFQIRLENRGGTAREVSIYAVGFGVQRKDGLWDFDTFPRVRIPWPYEDIKGSNIEKCRNIHRSKYTQLIDLFSINDPSPSEVNLNLEHAVESVEEKRRLDETRSYLIDVIAVGENYESPEPTRFRVSYAGTHTFSHPDPKLRGAYVNFESIRPNEFPITAPCFYGRT